MLNVDGLNNAPIEDVVQEAWRLVNAGQSTPHLQSAGAAMYFLLICKHHRADAADVFRAVSNLMAHRDTGEHPKFKALLDYIRYEVPRT